jgi:hypothetical protein
MPTPTPPSKRADGVGTTGVESGNSSSSGISISGPLTSVCTEGELEELLELSSQPVKLQSKRIPVNIKMIVKANFITRALQIIENEII